MIEGRDVPLMAVFPVLHPADGVTVLRAALQMLRSDRGGGWAGPRSHARDSRGNECPVLAARARFFAVGAAIVRATNELGLDVWAGISAQRLLARVTLMNPVEFNRSCRQATDVLAALDRAIKLGLKLSEEDHGKAQKAG